LWRRTAAVSEISKTGPVNKWEGRPADVDPDVVDAVESREDLIAVLNAMAADLDKHPDEWENASLPRYLEALTAFVGSLDSYYANLGEPMPDQPTWQMVATVLVAASGYE
jgi:hypothetical protein